MRASSKGEANSSAVRFRPEPVPANKTQLIRNRLNHESAVTLNSCKGAKVGIPWGESVPEMRGRLNLSRVVDKWAGKVKRREAEDALGGRKGRVCI